MRTGYALDAQEGEPCPVDGCDGTLEVDPHRNCSCHISPPCGACVEAALVCDDCGTRFEKED